jgi:hypothetical protein
MMKETYIYTQREEDLGLVDVFDFFFTLSLSLSMSFLCTLVRIDVCKNGYDATRIGTEKKKKKASNMHTHNLETVVERSGRVCVCVQSETNKHNTCKPVDVSVYFLLDGNGEEKKIFIEKEMKNFGISISRNERRAENRLFSRQISVRFAIICRLARASEPMTASVLDVHSLPSRWTRRLRNKHVGIGFLLLDRIEVSLKTMATFKGLIDAECGTTNPLIKLSQIYTRDNTHVLQVVQIDFDISIDLTLTAFD